ncbi:MAG: hypothetical protein A2Z14_03605 [Chloroflexi bacterium RBG_16_48_8]|nr:MAG: hypothetical protein A2Z14_03605 [Chloroflexi bacterium RBG_16_48_8]
MFWLNFETKWGRFGLVFLLVIGFALRLFVAWQPVPVLLEKNLPDDSYYYFLIAKNTAQLGNVSVDGINQTNGFHPLWALFLIPIFGSSSMPNDLHIHLALTLGGLLDVIAIWAISQITKKLGKDESFAILAGCLYAFNPFVVLQATNGLETSLAMATLMLFWLRFLYWLEGRSTKWKDVGIGLLTGLVLLARSDNAFFLGFAFLTALLHLGVKEFIRRAVILGLVVIIVVGPWMIWGKISVGSWIQESGLAVPYAIRERFAAGGGSTFSDLLSEAFQNLLYKAFWLHGDPTGLPFIIGLVIWPLIILGLIKRWREEDSHQEKLLLIPFIFGCGAMILFHAGLRWYARPWYFVPTAALFSISFSILLLRRIQWNRLSFLLTALLMGYFTLSGYVLWGPGLYPWQRDMYASALWIRENIQSDEVVGSFNSGIYAYYSNHRVVNLDGVANHQAYQAIKDSNILKYLQENGITKLVDYDHAIRNEYALFMGPGYPADLEEIAVLGGDIQHPLGLLRAYDIHGAVVP